MLHQDDMSHIELTYVSHVFMNQKDISTLESLLRIYESYPSELIDKTHFVIVDDCSPIKFTPPQFELNITWLRITDDITWNMAGARNLGVTYAKSDKIFITDIDRLLPLDTFEYLVNAKNPRNSIFKIRQQDEIDGKLRRGGHPNTFFLSRARFMQLNGYDEEYAGHYGYEDQAIIKHFKAHGTWQRYIPRHLVCINRVIDRENSYHSLVRDLSHNKVIYERKQSELKNLGENQGHSRKFLNFSWIVVREDRRENKPVKKLNKLWKILWIPRTILNILR